MRAAQSVLAAGLSNETAPSTLSMLSTGSFSGLRPLGELGYGYMTSEKHARQPLCGNSEGWGPLSQFRYDFTPCFMDVWISAVAAYGILFGAVAIWWLVRRKRKAEVGKNWHFLTKQVGRILNSLKENISVHASWRVALDTYLPPRIYVVILQSRASQVGVVRLY